MKVVPNGALNCSVLDGWWDEGYDPQVGWAIGSRENYPDEGHQDWLDSLALYNLIESEIAPLFYHRVDGGIPRGWVEMVKKSIRKLAPEFSTARMVRDYTTECYMPAADRFKTMEANELEAARQTRDWIEKVRQNWGQVRIESVRDSASVSNAMGSEITVTARVQLGVLTPNDVRVQAVAGKIVANRELTNTSAHDLQLTDTEDGIEIYEGRIRASVTGYQGYSVRVVPNNPNVSIPNELPVVTWE
jgi:starch phosphorylase